MIMTTGRSWDAAAVSGQLGAPLPSPPSSSLPSWSSQQQAFPSSMALAPWPSQPPQQQPAGSSSLYSWQPPQHDAFPAFDNAILFGTDMPPPFAQPAMWQPDTQTPPCLLNHELAVAAAQGIDLHGHGCYPVPWQWQASAAAPVAHAAPPPLDAVLPDAPPPPPAEPANPPMGRRRGRPRGSTNKAAAKPKPKPANKAAANPKPAKSTRQIPAAPTPGPGKERPTTEQPVAGATTPAVAGEEEEAVGTSGGEGAEQQEEEDEEDVEYAATDLPGVRFHPTDTELIGYLRRKYDGRRMPADIVKDFNVFQHHPSTVQEKCGDSIDGSWYVFTPRNRKYEDGDRPDRSVICEGNRKIGYWKSNVKETDVTVSGKVIGKTNALTFALGDQPKGKLTRWRMKEYRIHEHRRDRERERDPKRGKPSQRNLDPDYMLLDEWVICKLFYNKNKKDQDGVPVDAGGQQDGVPVDAGGQQDGVPVDVGGQQDGEVNVGADEEASGKDDNTNDGNPPSDEHEDYYTYLQEQEGCTLYMVPSSTNDFAFEDQ